ncbi:hypothetical protein [Enterococcus mediterraneensis]|uniref:hypothetical protein n=1 Tax=Enterococcus mediterraneensis TaxID=2364791 RepID=UPI000F05B7CB|nr:hypothetical protein [Enterococcus mediterraneensis]
MKKLVAFLFLIILLISVLFLSFDRRSKNSTKEETCVSSPKADFPIIFTISEVNNLDPDYQDIGRKINLAQLKTGEIIFTFDNLPNKYYTAIYLDGKQVMPATKATLRSFGFNVNEDKNSPFLSVGSHRLEAAIYETKKQAEQNIRKCRIFEMEYSYRIN